MKILITGGHFTPAYSIIQKLTDDQLLVVGRKYAFEGSESETHEYHLCKEQGIPFQTLDTGRLQRKFTHRTIPSVLRFPKGVFKAFQIVKKFKPDVVVTFGGYIALPVALAARILNIPIVLHEQTQKAGISAKIIGKFATVICISFESSRAYFPNKKIVYTGNPIREEFFLKATSGPYDGKKPFIYITGGSTGSHIINQTVGRILPELVKDFTVIHQCGNNKDTNDFELLTSLKESMNNEYQKKYIVKSFFTVDEVAYLFQHALLVVSRSGMNTVTELIASGAPALLIPFPYGQMNEQKENALLFQKIGLGEIIDQTDLTPQLLLSTIHAMIKDEKKYRGHASEAQKYIKKDATEAIVQMIYTYGRRSQNNPHTS